MNLQPRDRPIAYGPSTPIARLCAMNPPVTGSLRSQPPPEPASRPTRPVRAASFVARLATRRTIVRKGA